MSIPSKTEVLIVGGVSTLHVISFVLVQASKAPSPMLVTLLGMVIEVRLLHLKKAELPIVVTLFGMVIEVRLVQP